MARYLFEGVTSSLPGFVLYVPTAPIFCEMGMVSLPLGSTVEVSCLQVFNIIKNTKCMFKLNVRICLL